MMHGRKTSNLKTFVSLVKSNCGKVINKVVINVRLHVTCLLFSFVFD